MNSLTTLRYSECDMDDKMKAKAGSVLECVPDLSEELTETTQTSSTIYCLNQLMTELQPVPSICNDDEQQQEEEENKIKIIVSNRCLISRTWWKQLPSGSNSKKSNCYTWKMEEAHSSKSFLTTYQLTW